MGLRRIGPSSRPARKPTVKKTIAKKKSPPRKKSSDILYVRRIEPMNSKAQDDAEILIKADRIKRDQARYEKAKRARKGRK